LAVTIRFDALGSDGRSGWYNAFYNIEPNVRLKDLSWADGLLLNFFLIIYIIMFIPEVLLTLAKFPGNFKNFMSLKAQANDDPDTLIKKFRDDMVHFFDGRGVRYHFTSSVNLFAENLASVGLLWASIMSVYEAMMPMILPGQVDATSEECTQVFLEMEKSWTKSFFSGGGVVRGISPLANVMHCQQFAGTIDKYIMLQYQVFNQRGHWRHIMVIICLLMRCLSLLTLWGPLHWIADTAYLARTKLAYFMFVFLSMVLAFSVGMRVMFGAEYMQYESMGMSFTTLLLYTFGDADRAVYAVYPWIEESGTQVTICLLIYTIFVVTIGLSFFTTVILDAYSCAQDAEECARQERATEMETRKTILWLYGIDTTSPEKQKEEDDAASRATPTET